MSYASKTMQTMPMNGIMTSMSVPFLPEKRMPAATGARPEEMFDPLADRGAPPCQTVNASGDKAGIKLGRPRIKMA